jgi:heavy metal sensor kinase
MKTLARLWPLGIRLQLMLWYSAVFAILMGLSGAIFYFRLQISLAGSLDTALQLQAQQVAGDITVERGAIIIQDATADLPGFNPADQSLHLPPADVNLGVLVRVLNGRSVSFRITPAFRTVLVPTQSVTQPLHGIPWQGTVTTVDGQPVRLYSRALIQDGQIFGVVQVATSLTQIQATLHEVLIDLLWITPLLLVLSALVSFWLTSYAFAPIHRLTQTARIIKGGDLRQRVPLPQSHDELRHLAVTLNEMIAHLEQAFLRQRRFVTDASHELRTPITVIRSKAKLALLQVFTPEEYANVFQTIHNEAERLGRLISDLLVLASADEGQVRLEDETIRFDLLVEAVAATVDMLTEQHQVTIQVTVTEPTSVRGDEARLMQVVMNLLENAIYYNEAGGQVFVSVRAQQGQALLIVRDTGIGIAPEHLPFLFDRFYRVDSARIYTAGGNSGLGLSIVDWIVKAHGGSVTVESRVGAGSTFTVALPLCWSRGEDTSFSEPTPQQSKRKRHPA